MEKAKNKKYYPQKTPNFLVLSHDLLLNLQFYQRHKPAQLRLFGAINKVSAKIIPATISFLFFVKKHIFACIAKSLPKKPRNSIYNLMNFAQTSILAYCTLSTVLAIYKDRKFAIFALSRKSLSKYRLFYQEKLKIFAFNYPNICKNMHLFVI